MNRRIHQIGFSQRIRLEWLEQTANLVLAGNDKKSVNQALQKLLADKVSVGGSAVRGNREKIITILQKVWLTTPKELLLLREDGLDLLKRMPSQTHLAIHWGMTMAVYPFWAGVATQVGRLLKLQKFAVATQIQRRVREQYGERETVSRAARRVLRSFIDWGVLEDTKQKGVYQAGASILVGDNTLIAWLAEAFLHSRGGDPFPLKDLLEHPSFFPLNVKPVHIESISASSKRLEILRHGLDDSLLRLNPS
jgi:hypothetical protein